jgi:antitoxin component of RelBE/YafQ-DinJ toxin-antitoxin module
MRLLDAQATLHNARTSAEAKAHARSMLEEMGVDPDEI